ncbi:MAG: hypothetical protein H8D45_10050 [Bacteroidetes bacterium]|nr:hypothetical protein [Bacteroidota bacterium]
METKNFLITGMGRCGTAFLAKALDTSKKWSVTHQPDRDNDQQGFRQEKGAYYRERAKGISNRLTKPFYGEVNPMARLFIDEIDADIVLGVILRDPYDIWLSYVNRITVGPDTMNGWWNKELQPSLEWNYYYFCNDLRVLDSIMSNPEVVLISFVSMTTNISYINSISRKFGITDIGQIDISKKVNTSLNPLKYPLHTQSQYTLDNLEFPEKWRGHFDWFVDRWGNKF